MEEEKEMIRGKKCRDLQPGSLWEVGTRELRRKHAQKDNVPSTSRPYGGTGEICPCLRLVFSIALQSLREYRSYNKFLPRTM